MRVPPIGRLGVGLLVKDHTRTLYEFDKEQRRRVSVWDVLLFYVLPVLVGVLLGAFNVRLRGLSELLAGVAILTGLLFGLLVHVFTVGLKITEDDRFTTTSKVTILVDELRANVSYACGIGLFLTLTLMVGAAITKPSADGMAPWLSGLIAALVLHLGLTLFMVLKRVRTAYKLLAM